MFRETRQSRERHGRRAPLTLLAGLALGIGSLLAMPASETLAETAACSAAVPDAPQCACDVIGADWPVDSDFGELINAARRSLVAETSCLRHGAQPYWQIQLLTLRPQDANSLANLDPDITNDFPRQAWCTETVGYWHYMAWMPFLAGYADPEWHPSAYVRSVPQLRTWYQVEEGLRAQGKDGRGRWIWGSELDYEDFVPGVNGPCPGAYQALEAFNAAGGGWSDSCHHSQVVDSVVVWRRGAFDGPVMAVDVHVIEGNVGGGTFVDVNGATVKRAVVSDSRWYKNVIDYTRLGTKTAGCGGRKIQGWGIDLDANGEPRCDEGRITTVVTPYSIAFAAPIEPEDPDSSTVDAVVDYVLGRPGPILVSTNSSSVTTGGRLPGRDNHWLVPAGSPGVDPLYIQVDLRAEHPLPVSGVVIEWKGGIVPPQYQVLWGGSTGAPMSKTFVPASGGSPDPGAMQVPIPTRFGPAPSYAVRYLRVAIPVFALTRPYEITGLHYLFEYGKEDDNGGVDEALATLGVEAPGTTGGLLRLAPNRPNPFANRTVIAYELPADTLVEIAIYDVAGRRVRSFRDAPGRAGRNEVAWDGLDDSGQRVRNGSYFVEVRGAGERGVRRIVLLR